MKEQVDINVNVNVKHNEQEVEPENQLEEQSNTLQEPIEYSVAKFEMFCINRIEVDKALITLSTAGFGFSATYLMGDKISSYPHFILFGLGAACFGLCIALVLYILRENSNYIEAETSEQENTLESKLEKLDSYAAKFFVAAIFFVAVASISIAWQQLSTKLDKSSSSQSKITATATVSQSSNDLPLVLTITNKSIESQNQSSPIASKGALEDKATDETAQQDTVETTKQNTEEQSQTGVKE